MKSSTSEARKKQSPIGGDVLSVEGAKPQAEIRGCRSIKVTLQLTASEAAELTARAEDAGLQLSPYIRREVLAKAVSWESALVLCEVGRMRELLTRLWAASSEEPLDSPAVNAIAAQVAAIDALVLVARATGAAQ